ncbi:MAG TPA: GAF domain-containing protein [Pyrinomonadaceae bacterium]|nr:GAF domain-containing protein [Pyrinomonadaceae bacterium]
MIDDGFSDASEQFEYDDFASGNSNPSAAPLREAVNAIDVTNSLTAPLKRAIDDLLELAAKAVGSEEASVLVRDGNDGGLRFLTAISDVKEKLLKIRIPPGKGIAGLVFSSGQPMAVSDVSSEGSFWSEADKKTGFKTITLLATPLRTGNEAVGVLEFVNRPGAPPYPPFTPEEMDQAAFFADAIARIIDAHEIAELVEALFDRTLKAIAPEAEGTLDSNTDLREWAESVETAPEHRDLLLVWVAVREIYSRGDADRELCRELLEALARSTRKRSAASLNYSEF